MSDVFTIKRMALFTAAFVLLFSFILAFSSWVFIVPAAAAWAGFLYILMEA